MESKDSIKQQRTEENTVDGYLFRTSEDAETANRELEAVLEWKRTMQGYSQEQILDEYRKALTERKFRTPVGLEFLHQIREHLTENEKNEEEIPPIQVPFYLTQTRWQYSSANGKKLQTGTKNKMLHADKFQISVLLNIFLVLLVAGMFYIALDSRNPNILNYKTAIVNQYASWEESISAREDVVRKKEAELSLNAAEKTAK